MPDTFLAINKDYFGKSLSSCELLILSQIEEFIENGCLCYLTDKQLMEITGEKQHTVRNSLNHLEKNQIIVRDTRPVSGNGRANRRRTIGLQMGYQERILKGTLCDDKKNTA